MNQTSSTSNGNMIPPSPSKCSKDNTTATKVTDLANIQNVSSQEVSASESVGKATYSPKAESGRILSMILQHKSELRLPEDIESKLDDLTFTTNHDRVYFPIPFKETETTAALKAIEALVASSIADLKFGKPKRAIEINLEQTTCFLFQTYLSTIDGLGKYSDGVKSKLKDTDLHAAQSDPYRRLSANLYATGTPGAYYHIHGSLDATTTLAMIGLPPFRPDLKTVDDIATEIESHVQQFTIEELETKNKELKQAGVQALTHQQFLATPHGQENKDVLPWEVLTLESSTPPAPFAAPIAGEKPRILAGIKVLELCRIIAGPVIGRILAEYGADVLKVTSPTLSDVPYFQIDVNFGKRCIELDLKSVEGRAQFEELLDEADVVLDGYRPGAIERLGYGPQELKRRGEKRGKGYVYVNENCFGYTGAWKERAGWQQIADCATGVAFAQGAFMHPASSSSETPAPIIPPFPISDYGTGCLGAISALTALYHRAISGGSYHSRVSLMAYDLLLFRSGLLPPSTQSQLRASQPAEFFNLKHSDSVDRISGTVMRDMRKKYPELFEKGEWRERWWSGAYKAEVEVIRAVARVEGVDNGFVRASRPNGADVGGWEGFVEDQQRDQKEGDRKLA